MYLNQQVIVSLPILRIVLLFIWSLPFLLSAQSLDSTRRGAGRSKLQMFWKTAFDFRNDAAAGRYRKQEKNSERLAFPFETDGYKLTFEDNFDSLNTSIWQKGQPWGRFHAQYPHQYYGDSEVYVQNGLLVLENRFAPKAVTDRDSVYQVPYGTGLVNTYWSKNFKYGYFAIRSKNPSGPATWPAFWLTGKNNWPPEIDIFEMYGRCTGKDIHKQTMTLHFGKIETNTKTMRTDAARLSEGTDSAFHIYSCLWEPGRVTFYTDGVELITMKLTQWQEQFYREEMYIVLNNAVDHRYLHCIDNANLPVRFEVDWIRVYQKNSDSVQK